MIINCIREQVNLHAEKIAVQTASATFTYKQMVEAIDFTASRLYEKKPISNGTLAIYFPENKVEFIIYFLAASSIGWKTVPVDPKLPVEKVRKILQDSETDILITDTHQQWWDGAMIFPDIVCSTTLIKNNLPKATRESIFYLGYTSGTSGDPKGFVRTQESWTESFRNTGYEYNILAGDQVIIPGSLVHSLFLYGALHTLSTGATVELLGHFSADSLARRVDRHKKTVLYVVPTMMETLLKQPYPQWGDINLVISSGSKWNIDRRKRVEEMFTNAECIEFYGASELSFVSILHHRAAAEKMDSVGRPFAGVEVSIRDKHFQEVPCGEIGTLYVKSKMVFKEYHKLPQETADVFRNGWATAGDLARVDEESFIYLVGRANQMIISGGLNIYPDEVEQVFQTVPEVEECAVMGMPDTYWGEKVVAFIKWRHGKEDIELLKRVCLDHLPKYKWPKEFITVVEFPHTVSQKIARNELIQLYPEGFMNHE